MPKIDEQHAAKRIRNIESAALALFKKRGFHGVGLREIAKKAHISLGNIYNYYEGKEPIFDSILQRLHNQFTSPEGALARYLSQTQFPDDVEQMGHAIGQMVDANRDYLLLVYIDLVEFSGKHVRDQYADLAQRFDHAAKDRFDQLREKKRFKDVDPSVAFSLVYMQFFNYFIVERLMGAKGHLGLSDEQAISAIGNLFAHSLTPRS